MEQSLTIAVTSQGTFVGKEKSADSVSLVLDNVRALVKNQETGTTTIVHPFPGLMHEDHQHIALPNSSILCCFTASQEVMEAYRENIGLDPDDAE